MKITLLQSTALIAAVGPCAVWAQAVVPAYIAPTQQTEAGQYVDDTRGVYVPSHVQQRLRTHQEQIEQKNQSQNTGYTPDYVSGVAGQAGFERQVNRVSTGVEDTGVELERIAADPGLLTQPQGEGAANQQTGAFQRIAQASTGGADLTGYPSLATGGAPRVAPVPAAPPQGGYQINTTSVGQGPVTGLDMQNGQVRLKEDRIAVRRALQRMMDQIGGSQWAIVWDLDEQNIGLPDMEISLYAEEPFMNVLNAMLARLQTRSGQPLRVIRYDQTQRLVITDRQGDNPRAGMAGSVGPQTKEGAREVAVTETVLKESVVSLHYDEIPLVDALENIVNQAGKGQWRLRMYAGSDQVLKPAHIEEPFGIALERILRVFNLKFEVFPGGKLIVITGNDKFGFRGVE